MCVPKNLSNGWQYVNGHNATSCISEIVALLLLLLLPVQGLSAGWETTNPKDVKAFETGDLPAVKQILVKDNYIERDPSLLIFALQKAISSGKVEMIRYLKSRGWLEQCRKEKCYPIHLAATYGAVDVIKLLIAEGFDVKEITDPASPYGGETPLHYAARFGHPDAVKFLCEQGVDAGARNKRNRTALDESLRRSALRTLVGGDPQKEAKARADTIEATDYLNTHRCGG